MDDQLFKKAMSKFATGVTVVTTHVEGESYGMTANAFMSISLNPKLVLISVREQSKMNEFIKKAGKYAVSILNEDQVDVSKFFASSAAKEEKFEYGFLNDLPVIPGANVQLTCDIHNVHIEGDHVLYIGAVTEIEVAESGALGFYNGMYKKIS